MFAMDIGNGEVLLWMLWFFLFVLWFWLLLTIFGDLFRDPDLSGGVKAVWVIFMILLPFIGIFAYLIVRGNGMAGRAMDAHKQAQAQFDAYVRETAGPASPTSEIKQAKELLDSGAITQDEFERIKRDALANAS